MISDKLAKISYILTTECNLNCNFCYENGTKKNKLQLCENYINQFTQFIINNYVVCNNGLQIEIIGGEPLLFKNWFYIKNAVDLLIKNNIKINRIIIFTNNSIKNDEFTSFLKDINSKKINIEFNTMENLSYSCNNRLVSDNNKKAFAENEKAIKKIGLKINKNRIINKESINSYKEFLEELKKDKRKLFKGIMSEYTGKNDFNENDFYQITKILLSFLKENNIDLKNDEAIKIIEHSGLLYLNMIIYENIRNLKKRERYCMPFMEEIAITPKGNIVPCSRVLQFENNFTNINNENFIKDIEKYKCNMINGRAINVNQLGENCDECALNQICTPCKILPNKMLIKNNIFYFPKEKCDYEYAAFYGQLKAYKEILKGEK